MLERFHIFQDLDGSETGLVKDFLERKEYGPNEVIYKEGETGDSLNIIAKGKVKINKMMVEGDQFCIATLKEGDIFGIMSFLDGSAHDATIVSDRQTELIVLGRSDFERLVDSNPFAGSKILRRIAMHLASIVRNMNCQYMDLMHLMFRKSK